MDICHNVSTIVRLLSTVRGSCRRPCLCDLVAIGYAAHASADQLEDCDLGLDARARVVSSIEHHRWS